MDVVKSYRVCTLAMHPLTGWRRVVLRFLGSVLPKNDPDFHDQRQSIDYWWLELEARGVATREIGFSASGTPLRYAPIARNRGVFIGARVNPTRLAGAVSEQDFEANWGRASEIVHVRWPQQRRS